MALRPSSSLLVGAIVLIASRAAADPTNESVRLHYAPPPGEACPTAAVLRSRVSALTAKVTFVEGDSALDVASLAIGITEDDHRYSGSLSFRRAKTGEASERRVSSASCDDVVQALALVAALAIDPEARTEGASFVPPVAEERPLSAPPNGPSIVAPSSGGRSEPDRATARGAWASDVVLGATAATAQAPSALLGVRLGLARTRTSDALFRPDAALLLDVASSGPTEDEAVRGRFTLIALSARSCPLAVRPGTRMLELGLCARARLGTVRASGQNLDRPESRGAFWAEGIVEGRVRAGAPSRGGLFAELSVGLAVRGTRPTYYRETPYRSVYEVPLLGLDTGASLGAYLP